ncbi:MAG: twin-arginine translocase subunit TatC [Prevotella sp.]|jgi:sec-independent protein translocase protein TatC
MADEQDMTFWDHLDVLRLDLIRMLLVWFVCSVVAFCLKEQMFDIVLAPKNSDFVSYRIIGVHPFDIKLVNIGITEQFLIHVKTALLFGVVAASPYLLYVLYRFIAPGLYARERRYATRLVVAGYLMFIVGLLVNYFIVFPLTLRFLATYSVSAEVGNMLSLQSYMDTLLMMSLLFGIVFEIPVLSWLLAVFGLLRAEWMRHYRRYAIVAIVILAAVITPTSDALTLFIVSLPIWLLYEASVLIVGKVEKSTDIQNNEI